ncbi:nitrous oxide reductase family maturation protein NosD [Billgrantia kenyensis]|uniref:Nitrous oxide reductase family maturation protein NosD n=1 Tax=Billgrantia kenyensis TaxID=321266 RepID=A0A7W0AF57_9GAMM|nr:nitrous oxide reductase family maturation protein NosD [Halomonas kenyensis]MBA2781056.1 nitrous oxide reductase family maturation protein NosD [Halomonas kenyensis]MCG6661507.1 nitrous oxide reductase family maturation protein NosD [Halomonas kenyensis]
MRKTWLFLLLLFPALSLAAERVVAPGEQPLQEVLDAARDGDTVRLSPGIYAGNFIVSSSIELIGEEGAVLDGQGQGSVLSVKAPGVGVRGLRVRNDGANLTEIDSGIFVATEATGTVIENNRIEARGFGIWLDAAADVRVEGNRISGDTTLRSQDRGNGLQLFNVSGAEIIGNEVWETRDGIYIDVSDNNRLIGNVLRDQRYGMHYMFSHSNEVRDNTTRNNRLGYALMQSRRLEVVGNRSIRDQNYGFLLNFIVDSVIAENISIEAQRGGVAAAPDGHAISGAEGKALFVYNSLFNEIRDNLFARTEIGIHMTAGSEDNEFHGNAFVGNESQVKYVALREQEWSFEGRGNYWSDYLGWDLSGDGIGDIPYEPNDSVDRLIWTYPMAKILMNSPAVQVLRWVQREFPILRPPGVRDSHPLMTLPEWMAEALQ